MISIITPTYNRAHLLCRLYNSLRHQTCDDFEWIIVDDGSTDNTIEIVHKFLNDNIISIKFLHQQNRGKHIAINLALPHCIGDWVCIVDSDDLLSYDAIEILSNHAKLVKSEEICGISAIKVTFDNKVIGKHPDDPVIDLPFFDYYFRMNYKGDRLLMFRADLMKQNPFPVFDNEKFIPEGVIWQTITKNKLVRFINSRLNFCEYQPDGLTAQYRNLMEANPIGNALYYKLLSEHKRASFLTKIRCSLIHLYLLEIAKKNGSDVTPVATDKRLSRYHIIAEIIMPIYKLKRILCG